MFYFLCFGGPNGHTYIQRTVKANVVPPPDSKFEIANRLLKSPRLPDFDNCRYDVLLKNFKIKWI